MDSKAFGPFITLINLNSLILMSFKSFSEHHKKTPMRCHTGVIFNSKSSHQMVLIHYFGFKMLSIRAAASAR